jgi:hypothetical protein
MSSDPENCITITVSGNPDLGKLAVIYQLKSYLRGCNFDVETHYQEGLNFEIAGGRRVTETLQGISRNTKIQIIEEPNNE